MWRTGSLCAENASAEDVEDESAEEILSEKILRKYDAGRVPAAPAARGSAERFARWGCTKHFRCRARAVKHRSAECRWNDDVATVVMFRVRSAVPGSGCCSDGRGVQLPARHGGRDGDVPDRHQCSRPRRRDRAQRQDYSRN